MYTIRFVSPPCSEVDLFHGMVLVLALALGLALATRFDCETITCAKHDMWEPATFENSSQVCQDAQANALNQFVTIAPQQCREWAAAGMGVWEDCRKMYCQTLGYLASNLSHQGSNLYYGYDECRPLVDFNQTLCETSYRDASGFCDCLCPMMGLLQIPSVGGCESKIMEFLFIGRRGYNLSQKYGLSGYCAGFLCEFFAKLGEPIPPYPIQGIPEVCKTLDLPWRIFNCNEPFGGKRGTSYTHFQQSSDLRRRCNNDVLTKIRAS